MSLQVTGTASRAPGAVRRNGWVITLALAVALIVGVLGLYKVWYHYQTIGLGYELADETFLHRELFAQHRRLKLELASLMREGLLVRESDPLHPMRVVRPEDKIFLPSESGAGGPPAAAPRRVVPAGDGPAAVQGQDSAAAASSDHARRSPAPVPTGVPVAPPAWPEPPGAPDDPL